MHNKSMLFIKTKPLCFLKLFSEIRIEKIKNCQRSNFTYTMKLDEKVNLSIEHLLQVNSKNASKLHLKNKYFTQLKTNACSEIKVYYVCCFSANIRREKKTYVHLKNLAHNSQF